MVLRNTGTKDIDVEIHEVPGEGPVPFAGDPVKLSLDDGEMDNAVGFGGDVQFITLSRFTPVASQFPFILKQVQVYIGDSALGAQTGDPIAVYVYRNKTGNQDPAQGAELLYSQVASVGAQYAWTTVDLDNPISLEGPGDVLIGIGFLMKPGRAYFHATIDTTESQQRSWIGVWDGDIPAEPTLPPDNGWALIDSLDVKLAGNWMIRGIGETGSNLPGDIPWLTLDKTTGTVTKDGDELRITATFNAVNLALGDYFGQLRITNQPNPWVFVPVQMRVTDDLTMYLLHLTIIKKAD